MTTAFTPLTKGISWTLSTTGAGGVPLPAGEVPVSTTLGIRPDGNPAYSMGNYQYLVIVLAPATSESLSSLTAAIKSLPAGNYWLNGMQTDALGGSQWASAWSNTETPFSISGAMVAPESPTNFKIA